MSDNEERAAIAGFLAPKPDEIIRRAIMQAGQGALPMPPGCVGYLADYVLKHAIRPVPEVAVVAALGIVAGIAGREWTTFTNSGLNLYVVLVARSAIGKEAMHTGIATIMRGMETHYPAVSDAFNFRQPK